MNKTKKNNRKKGDTVKAINHSIKTRNKKRKEKLIDKRRNKRKDTK